MRECVLAILVSLLLSSTTTPLFPTNAEFSQKRTLPPVKLSAADLDTILHKTHAFIASANGLAADDESVRESVKLGVRGHEIEIAHFSLASSVAFPKELFKFSYTYNRSNKPISTVTIDLGDDSRQVSVTGEAPDQIKPIADLIEKDLRRFSTAIGGASFRRVAGVCLTVIFLAFLGLGGAWWWHTRTYNALGILICSTIGLFLVLLLPWPRYLPANTLLSVEARPVVVIYSVSQIRACSSSLGEKNFTGARRTPAPAKASARVSQRGSARIAILLIL